MRRRIDREAGEKDRATGCTRNVRRYDVVR